MPEATSQPQFPSLSYVGSDMKKDEKKQGQNGTLGLSSVEAIAQNPMEYQNMENISGSENISKTFNSGMEIPGDTYNSKNENDPNLSKSSNEQKRADAIRGGNSNQSQSEDTKNNLKQLQGSSGRNGSSNESPHVLPVI